ncbi:MAG: glycosyltransferase family 2 protein, partial [Planctomycetota bacterium]
MDGLWIWIAAPGCLLWGGLLLLPWQPWRVRERLEAAPGGPGADLGLVTAVIPARNEAALLPRSLGALAAQSPDLEVVLVDDCSEDGT